MAKSRYNVVMHSASGLVGDLLVFRQRNGKTIIAKRPTFTKEPQPINLEIRERFKKAAAYASAIMEKPVEKQRYQEKAYGDVTAFNLALADYFRAPKIEDVQIAAYTGAVGSSLTIKATDDFMVKSVNVTIYAPDGTLVEKGLAMEKDPGEFVYTATAFNGSLHNSRILVEVSDNPGNVTTLELHLP